MKVFFSALFGFTFSLFVEGFSRIIISFFHKQEFFFFGIGALPSTSWIVVIYFVSSIATWLGAMLAFSFADTKSKKAFYIFLSLLLFWISFETLSSLQMVPTWYSLTYPLTSIVGLFISRFTYKLK